ncbi:hypothetical protein NMY22_g19456 [Coprinellus aureogranulatus]|nr:hypothetical protein NMY22_g19456 [Coprinellus aureogranulatus]
MTPLSADVHLMTPALLVEIYNLIFEYFVADVSLGDGFDERVSPFNERLPPYPDRRKELATVCTLVSKQFYDIATLQVWGYLIVRSEEDLEALIEQLHRSMSRPSTDVDRSMDLLSRLPEVKVLTLECRAQPSPLWRHPCSARFISAIPRLRPHLERQQFLDPREAPTLLEVARLSRSLIESRAFQVVNLSDSVDQAYFDAIAEEGDRTS